MRSAGTRVRRALRDVAFAGAWLSDPRKGPFGERPFRYGRRWIIHLARHRQIEVRVTPRSKVDLKSLPLARFQRVDSLVPIYGSGSRMEDQHVAEYQFLRADRKAELFGREGNVPTAGQQFPQGR